MICETDGRCRLKQEVTFSKMSCGCEEQYRTLNKALPRPQQHWDVFTLSEHEDSFPSSGPSSPHVFLEFYFLFLINISVNDLEVVAEILVDALLLNQTCLWNASEIFACFYGAGLSTHCPIYCSDLIVLLVWLFGLPV